MISLPCTTVRRLGVRRLCDRARIGLIALALLAAPVVGQGDRQEKAFIGVKVKENAETLEEVGEHVGVRIVEVIDNSPAKAAGLRVGDVIETLNGVSHAWPDKFNAAVEALRPGVKATLEIVRDDVGLEIVVVPNVRKAARPEAKLLYLVERERVGIRVRALGRAEARAAGLPASEGVGLVGFWGNSPWRRDGLEVGDILHRMDGRALHDPRELIRRVRRKAIGQAVRLTIVRKGKRMEIITVASAKMRRTERVLVPLLFNYRSETEQDSEWGALFDIFQTQYKEGKRTTTLLWVISWSTGEGESLRELPVPEAGPTS